MSGSDRIGERWFARVLSAVSLFSLLQGWAGFGANAVLDRVVDLYRSIFHDPAIWISEFLKFELPSILIDIGVIYLLVAGAIFRYTAIYMDAAVRHKSIKYELSSEYRRGHRYRPKVMLLPPVVAHSLMALFWPILIWPFFRWHISVIRKADLVTYPDAAADELARPIPSKYHRRGIIREVRLALFSLALMLLFNAWTP